MRIVVGVDGSEPSQVALELVAGTPWQDDSTIRVVTAAERGEEHQPELAERLDAMAMPLRERPYAIETVVTHGRAADALLAEAEIAEADLIVVGSRGLGLVGSALLGSVSAAIVDQAPCPVLVAKRPQISRILLATDGSRSAEAIPAVLGAWDAFRSVPIDVVAVGPSSAGKRAEGTVSWMVDGARQSFDASHEVDRHRVIADEMAARLGRGGWRARGIVRRGDPAKEIEAAATELDADLIVTGSRGLSGLQRLLLGSVAHHVLLHSDRSVLVMRGHVAARERRPQLVPLEAQP
jgi:nucleotide-binding universal stress UspA family protein